MTSPIARNRALEMQSKIKHCKVGPPKQFLELKTLGFNNQFIESNHSIILGFFLFGSAGKLRYNLFELNFVKELTTF